MRKTQQTIAPMNEAMVWMGCVQKGLFGFLERDSEVAVLAGLRAFAEAEDDDFGSVNVQSSLDEVD